MADSDAEAELLAVGEEAERSIEQPAELAEAVCDLLGKGAALTRDGHAAEAGSTVLSAGVHLLKASSAPQLAERVLRLAVSRASVGAEELREGVALPGSNRLLSEALTWLSHAQAQRGALRDAKLSLEHSLSAIANLSIADQSCKLRLLCQLLRAKEHDFTRHSHVLERWQHSISEASHDGHPPVDVATSEAMLASEQMHALMEQGRLADSYEVGKRDLLESVRKASALSPLRRSDLLPSIGQTHSQLSVVCNRLGDDVSAESHCRAAVWEQAADLGIGKRKDRSHNPFNTTDDAHDDDDDHDDDDGDEYDLPRVEGVSDQDLASSMMNLADFLIFRKQLDEAAECYLRLESMVHEDSGFRGVILYKLGNTRSKLNDSINLERAVDCYTLALRYTEQAHGRKTKERIWTLMNRALAQQSLSRLQDAYDDADAAFKISGEICGNDHKWTRHILGNLKSLHKRLQSQPCDKANKASERKQPLNGTDRPEEAVDAAAQAAAKTAVGAYEGGMKSNGSLRGGFL